jgi:hypothetical protein
MLVSSLTEHVNQQHQHLFRGKVSECAISSPLASSLMWDWRHPYLYRSVSGCLGFAGQISWSVETVHSSVDPYQNEEFQRTNFECNCLSDDR